VQWIGALSASLSCRFGLHLERSHRQGPKQLALRPRQIQPCAPIVAIEHRNLTIVNWRDIRAGFGCQHRETGRAVERIGSHSGRIDVVEFLDLADAIGFDPREAIKKLAAIKAR
jgi:hypothetical protein